MAIKHSSVDVGTSAVSLIGSVTDTKGQTWARTVLISNTGAATVFLGGSGVTAAAYGYALAAGGEISLELDGGDEPFAVAASGTVTVHVLHMGV